MKTAGLNIVTDLQNTHWLKYILEEFKSINGFEAGIDIVNSNKINVSKLENVIFYTQDYQGGKVTLVNKSNILPQGNIQYINEKIYVVEDTKTSDLRFALSYDLFWNAFVFLSRLEEYRASLKGQKTLSHCLLHPRHDKKSLTVPIVNWLFNDLEILIRESFPHLTFKATPIAKIELSHDVDYLSKTLQFMLKQSILNTYDIFRFIFKGPDALRSLNQSVKFLFSKPSYWCFDYWENIEKQSNRRSIFYIHAQAIRKDLRTWIIDPTYDLLKNKPLQEKLRELRKEGFEIGLHGSYLAAINEKLARQEKEILENVLQEPVTKVRQHWLRFNEDITPYIHNKLFKYDSTLGWNDRVGFRNGCASLFHPYDHKNDCAFNYVEIPQVIMDFNIYQSQGVENVYFVERTLQILDALEHCKSVHVAVSWHQQVCNEDYQWHKTYEMVLKHIEKTHPKDKLEAYA